MHSTVSPPPALPRQPTLSLRTRMPRLHRTLLRLGRAALLVASAYAGVAVLSLLISAWGGQAVLSASLGLGFGALSLVGSVRGLEHYQALLAARQVGHIPAALMTRASAAMDHVLPGDGLGAPSQLGVLDSEATVQSAPMTAPLRSTPPLRARGWTSDVETEEETVISPVAGARTH